MSEAWAQVTKVPSDNDPYMELRVGKDSKVQPGDAILYGSLCIRIVAFIPCCDLCEDTLALARLEPLREAKDCAPLAGGNDGALAAPCLPSSLVVLN